MGSQEIGSANITSLSSPPSCTAAASGAAFPGGLTGLLCSFLTSSSWAGSTGWIRGSCLDALLASPSAAAAKLKGHFTPGQIGQKLQILRECYDTAKDYEESLRSAITAKQGQKMPAGEAPVHAGHNFWSSFYYFHFDEGVAEQDIWEE